MIRMPAIVVACAAAIVFVCPAAHAKDVIELNSGEKVEGKFVEEDRSEITIQTNETKLVLPKSMIKTMKIEVEEVRLGDGRVMSGQIESENDSTLTLRMRLGGITIDKMDIESRQTKVIEQKPQIWEKRETSRTSSGSGLRRKKTSATSLDKIKFPDPTESLSEGEIQQLHRRASDLHRRKQYKEAIELYQKILRTNPKDMIALYNLACACALAGDKRNAVDFLMMSVAAGYTDFSHMEKDTDLDSIRGEKGYKVLLSERDAIQLRAASQQLDALKKHFGEGYTYEIEETRKLIFATNQSLEMLGRMKDHLFKFADAQWRQLWDNKPSYYITIICPDRQTFQKMARPGVGGWYTHQQRQLICGDIGLTLDHEFTHALHFADQDMKRMQAPIYIIEGFSTLFESSGLQGTKLVPRKISGRLNAVRQAVSQGRHSPWDQFSRMSQQQYMGNAGLHYSQSRYIMVYLWDTDKLKKWYDKYCETFSQDMTAKVAWESIFGKSFSEVEQDWKTWLLGLQYETPKSVRPGGPFLGVQSEECDEGIALYQVVADSPADKGGLREGDILTHADDKQIKTHNDFIDFLNEHKPGDTVKFKVIRGKTKKTITVTLGTRPGR